MKTPQPHHPGPAGEQPQIDYPCHWSYTVIGEDETELRTIIADACAPAIVAVSLSQRSAGGRYLSLHASLVVDSAATRQAIHQSLQSHPAVKIVL